IRPYWTGGFWEIGEVNCEIKAENIKNGTIGMDDVWGGVKENPLIRSVRGGALPVPHRPGARMGCNSKASPLFHASSMNAAFYQGERVATGILATNAFWDERTTYQAFFGRPSLNDSATDFSNGDYEGIFRLSGLPIWDADGRCFLHIAGSATFRHTRT